MASNQNNGEGSISLPTPDGADTPIARVLGLPARLAGLVSTLLIIVMLALVTYSIFQRYFLDTPLKWGDELLGYMLVAFVFLGAAEALRRGDHISIDLISDRLKGKTRRAFSMIHCLSIIAFALVVGISTWHSIGFAYDFGSYSPGYLEMPMWIPQIPMLIGSLLLALVGLGRLIALFAAK